jgi:hypothetical protein
MKRAGSSSVWILLAVVATALAGIATGCSTVPVSAVAQSGLLCAGNTYPVCTGGYATRIDRPFITPGRTCRCSTLSAIH